MEALLGRLGVWLALLAASSNDSVILAVIADPEPDDVRAVLNGGGTIKDTDTNRPHPANFLEGGGGMPGIGLGQLCVLVRKPLDLFRKLSIELPKTSGWRG